MIKFRKFWKRSPVEKVHNTRKIKDTNITDDDLKIYIKCPDCKGWGYLKEVKKLEHGAINHIIRCKKCYGLGEIDSGQTYGGK